MCWRLDQKLRSFQKRQGLQNREEDARTPPPTSISLYSGIASGAVTRAARPLRAELTLAAETPSRGAGAEGARSILVRRAEREEASRRKRAWGVWDWEESEIVVEWKNHGNG